MSAPLETVALADREEKLDGRVYRRDGRRVKCLCRLSFMRVRHRIATNNWRFFT
jgi:hypothetical protein